MTEIRPGAGGEDFLPRDTGGAFGGGSIEGSQPPLTGGVESPSTPQRRRGVPDLSGLVDGVFDAEAVSRIADEAAAETRETVAEARKFKGPMAEQISKLQKEGIGRVVGVPLNGIPKLPGGPEHPYQAVMYVLPLSDENAGESDPQALAIFPHANGCDYAVIKPRKSTAKSKEEIRLENNVARENFENHYLTPGDPIILTTPAWEPRQGEKPFDTFSRTTENYPISVVHYITTEEGRANLTKNAVKQARKNNAKRLKIDDSVLGDIIPTDLAAELEVTISDWEAQKRIEQEQEHRRRDEQATLDKDVLKDYDWDTADSEVALEAQGEIFSAEDPGLSPEQLGFQGPMAERIKKWQQEGGLGKEIVVPIAQRGENGEQLYRSAMYALPLDEETGLYQKVLLIFPHQHSFDFKIVRPKISISEEDDERTIENENYVHEFNLIFRQADIDRPYTLDQWTPHQGIPAVDSFSQSIHLIPADIMQTIGVDKDKLVDEAEAVARRLKFKRIKTDEYTMRDQLDLDPDLIGLFDVADRDWNEMKRDEERKWFDDDPGFPNSA